jgi:hypothetical protein
MKDPCKLLLDLSLDTAHLTCESSHVIGLRLALAAQGGPLAQAEAIRMVSEKAQAMVDAQFMFAYSLITGEAHLAPARTVALYRDRVQANHRRLTQGE